MPAAMFTGQVVDPSGEVLFGRVSGAYWISPNEGYLHWTGEFTIESGEPPRLADQVRLVFDDRRHALIRISRYRMPSPLVEFTGIGCPPE
ncbi:MAG: hypothetical protein KF774_21195 [Planctomyces sp.]|nr:hypothetical protein [Planctomyces sp.]